MEQSAPFHPNVSCTFGFLISHLCKDLKFTSYHYEVIQTNDFKGIKTKFYQSLNILS